MPELTTLGDVSDIADDDRVPVVRPGAIVLQDMTIAELRGAMLKNAAFHAAFLAWIASLPTDPPTQPGIPWNNGGVPVVSS